LLLNCNVQKKEKITANGGSVMDYIQRLIKETSLTIRETGEFETKQAIINDKVYDNIMQSCVKKQMTDLRKVLRQIQTKAEERGRS